MNKTLKYILIVLGALLAMAAVGTALAYFSMQPDYSTPRNSDSSNSQNSKSNPDVVTAVELAQNNGLDGNNCYVAIDGTVYLIKGVAQWAMGVHTTANDASVACGKDLTEKLGQSPHGAKVLQKLSVVGTLQQ